MPIKYYYAVKLGRRTGVFHCWEDCKEQVNGHVGARYKKFRIRKEAEDYVLELAVVTVADGTQSTSTSTARPVNGHTESAAESSRPSGSNVLLDESPVATEVEDQDALTEVEDNAQQSYPLAPRTLASKPDKGKQREQLAAREPRRSPKRHEDLVVYCDGACKGNGQDGSVAGIGVWWAHDDKRNLSERCPGLQTNNCAELVAIVRCLEKTSIDVKRKLIIKTDSQYAINCLTDWIFNNWTKTGTDYRTRKGQLVKNSDLISYAATLLSCREMLGQKVELVHVRGHRGIEGNEEADKLANLGSKLKSRRARDWGLKEQKYKEAAERARDDAYLRIYGSMRIDIISTSQEEAERGGFRIERKRAGAIVHSTGAAEGPAVSGDESEHPAPEDGPTPSQDEQVILRPVGPSQRYRSDASAFSGSTPSSPNRQLDTTPTQATQRLGDEITTRLRAKRQAAGKTMNRWKSQTAAYREVQVDVRGNQTTIQQHDMLAYAEVWANGDDLERDLRD
ncbi:hypothetical protein AAF712_006428 [Marasmius tenuissimus]|uniref:ribonuclease H n=1 Tax=Marasmius tenuissimus TaxID=585030 RepID=A0ABR3A0S7_9AGAR